MVPDGPQIDSDALSDVPAPTTPIRVRSSYETMRTAYLGLLREHKFGYSGGMSFCSCGQWGTRYGIFVDPEEAPVRWFDEHLSHTPLWMELEMRVP